MSGVKSKYLSRRAFRPPFGPRRLGHGSASLRRGGRSAPRSSATRFSYLYAVEWPAFAVLGVFGWYALLNMEKVTEHQETVRKEYEEKMRAEAQLARRVEEEEDPRSRLQRPPRRDRLASEEEALGTLMEVAFRRYRIMSFITGTTLLTLYVMLLLHTFDLALWKHLKILVERRWLGARHRDVPALHDRQLQHGAEVPPAARVAPPDVDCRILSRRRVLLEYRNAAAALPRRTAGQMSNLWLERRVIAFAHQGGSFEGPSSTLAAITRALAEGATGIELERPRHRGSTPRRLSRRHGRPHDEPSRGDSRPHVGAVARYGQRLLVDCRCDGHAR